MTEHMTWTAFWVLFFVSWSVAGIAYYQDRKRRR